MRVRWLPLLPLCVALGCGDDTVPDPTPDAGPAPDAGPVCGLAFVEASGGATRVGAHLTLALEGGATDLSATAPDGVRARIEGDTLRVVAPYRVGPISVSVSGACPGGERVEVERTLDVRPLAFSRATTWTWGDDGPDGREYFSMWITPQRPDRLWLLGGFLYRPAQFTPASDAWSLDLVSSAWTRQADAPPEALPGAGLAVHPDGYAMRYGGLNDGQIAGAGQIPFALVRVDAEADGLTFTSPTVEGAPTTGDYQPTFFFHPPSERFYAVCGAGARNSSCNLWSFDPATGVWAAERTEGTDPTGRNGHFWAYDPATDRLIVFSGEASPASATCTNCLHDTWALEMGETPPRWVQLAADGGALGEFGRRNGTYALDPANQRFLVWGGTPDGRTSAPGLFALDLERGHEAWHEVPTEGDAPVRASGGMVYDVARRRMLVGFGNGGRVYIDLWALDLD